MTREEWYDTYRKWRAYLSHRIRINGKDIDDYPDAFWDSKNPHRFGFTLNIIKSRGRGYVLQSDKLRHLIWKNNLRIIQERKRKNITDRSVKYVLKSGSTITAVPNFTLPSRPCP